MEKVAGILEGFVDEATWAAEAEISPRTVARYRAMANGLPFIEFGGKIYIPRDDSREWIRSRIKRPNQRRQTA